MTDDEVGRCTFTVRELGFSQRDQIKPLNLTYLKKKGTIPEQAGMIRIKAILNWCWIMIKNIIYHRY